MGWIKVGDLEPVRLMGVINLSQESFYKGSVVSPNEALAAARRLQEEGAEIIDLGAVSTAPGSPPISEERERERLFPSLKEIADNLDVVISADTQRAKIAEKALACGAACINDVSGLHDPDMASKVAEYDGSLIIMASDQRPGDLPALSQIIPHLGERVREATRAGVDLDKISIDPGIGKWMPERTAAQDLAILDGFDRLRIIGRPVMAALSRKSFIGESLKIPDPGERLAGSLAATAVAVYQGAHIVRTHDISASREAIAMATAIRGRPAEASSGDLEVEVLGYLGQGMDLAEHLKRMEVEQGAYQLLSRKGSFRLLMVRGLSSMEALIIKQEMLARGGDAAIPKLALRCDERPQEILILGTHAQISSLIRNLKRQPFRLSQLAAIIKESLELIDSPERYR
ncbi:MAG TPA: dihydropteroate synthase [Methanothrix sp.]|uniref:dihydropteroate synthase n=1 Tax=Methanothrix sp. TaxID=90426 RepID=UPI002CDBFCE5|nr:dihydropteroate synthase [Methanothrix sp.]MDI9417098.1 dihydropteroate synthase [Euryarchaeota archaeon]HON36450.1 dihydropteroate synthase [Methanothrix sp.]HRU76612.1 dihydropteroate synthase [Methanothrix sp.]